MKRFSQYLDTLARANGLSDGPVLPLWQFYPGMLQDSHGMWWADFGRRSTCHEGVDICFYSLPGTPFSPLAPGAAVPAMFSGRILNITGDLLGQSVVVDLEEKSDDRPVMVYSHLDALAGLAPGDLIKRGQIIGHTFDTRTRGSRLLSHLHLSCICLWSAPVHNPLDWTLFTDREKVFHLNPVFL